MEMAKTWFIVTISPELTEITNVKGGIIGDPPLSAQGKKILAKLKYWLNKPQRNISSVYCGSGRRFWQAAFILFPLRHMAEFKTSPIFGEAAMIRRLNGEDYLILGCGLVLPRICLYDRMPPTEEDEREVMLLRVSTLDSMLNLPDRAVVITEDRPLAILGLPAKKFRPGALYQLDYESSQPLKFKLLTEPKTSSVQAA